MTGDSATDVLKWIIQVVRQRDLSDYKTAWRTAESAVEIKSQWKLSNQSFVKAVADACRTHLCAHSSDWELDDESTRRLLNFEGLNSKTLEWTPVRPTMRGSPAPLGGRTPGPLGEKLRSWRSLRRRGGSPPATELVLEVLDGYDFGPDTHSKLDELCDLIPELGVLHAWTQDDWASTIYELMLLARELSG